MCDGTTTPITDLVIAEVTTATVDGTGAFDVFMRASKAHLEQEFTKGRIKGAEYSTVYLGLMNMAMTAALQFAFNQRKTKLESDNLVKQGCVLDATYDNTVQTTLRVAQETNLMTQKVQTEKAQTQSAGVETDSVIGRQKVLYLNQANGFIRDAEQKAAKLMADTWSVRRTTDDGTVADSNNMLYDTAIGRAINVLLTGVNA